MKPCGVLEQSICACGQEPCRPGQRTGLKCHAAAMKKYRQGPQSSHRQSGLGSRPPLERMVMIWKLVRGRAYPNATFLARQLETSTKSIHRDIEFMRDRLGFDIRYDRSRFGYFTPPGPCSCPFCHPDKWVLRPNADGEAVEIHERQSNKTPDVWYGDKL